MALTGSLLLVDDEEEFVQILLRRFERRGMEVVVCLDHQTAIDAVLQRPFDVVLLDRKLGRFDGVNLARDVKRSDASMQVLMLSGYNDPDSIDEARAAGVDEYLVKPCALSRLETAVEEALRRGRSQRDGTGLLVTSIH